MLLKVLLNIFYNISLILLVMSIIWSFNHNRYDLLAAAVFSITLVIILKIRLIKQNKELTRRN